MLGCGGLGCSGVTPDPSAVPQAVWVAGVTGDPLDLVKLSILAVVVGLALVSFSLALCAGLLMRAR